MNLAGRKVVATSNYRQRVRKGAVAFVSWSDANDMRVEGYGGYTFITPNSSRLGIWALYKPKNERCVL